MKLYFKNIYYDNFLSVIWNDRVIAYFTYNSIIIDSCKDQVDISACAEPSRNDHAEKR